MPTVFQYSLYLPTFNLQPFMRYHRSKVINNFLPTANGGEQKSVDRGKQDRKQRHKSIHWFKFFNKLSADISSGYYRSNLIRAYWFGWKTGRLIWGKNRRFGDFGPLHMNETSKSSYNLRDASIVWHIVRGRAVRAGHLAEKQNEKILSAYFNHSPGRIPPVLAKNSEITMKTPTSNACEH